MLESVEAPDSVASPIADSIAAPVADQPLTGPAVLPDLDLALSPDNRVGESVVAEPVAETIVEVDAAEIDAIDALSDNAILTESDLLPDDDFELDDINTIDTNTIDTVNSVDTVDTVDSVDAVQTVDAVSPVNTVDTVNTVDATDTYAIDPISSINPTSAAAASPALVADPLTDTSAYNASVATTADGAEEKQRFQWSASNIVLGSAIGSFLLVSGVYGLSRPCVVGSCEQLQRAQQLSQEAVETAQTTESALEVVEAHKKLNEASYLLGTIPMWSPHYQSAQGLLKRYEEQSVLLGQVVEALEKANTAAQRSQNPPHPLQEWREIQWLWREVIEQLEEISPDNPLYSLVQRKLEEYRANLANVNQRVGIEQQAQDRIAAARQAGEMASARAEAAKSAENWQETVATWTTAIDQLKQIPEGTSAYNEAIQLLAIYQPRLTEATTRQTQEQTAADAYTQAISYAEQARRLEQQNQWSQAVTYWQDALNYARQVPSDSVYYGQAQPLIDTYTQTLQQAQGNSRRSSVIQTAKPNFDQACAGNPQICTYTLSPEAVRIQFTSAYDRTVEGLINSARQQGSPGFPPATVNQVNGLLRALANISDATQVPIELYNSNGAKLGTYAPTLSGYVPQQ
nr:MAG: hypothetical protein EDM05_10895 [Leptolyngbya sp. IPPAS B-1204]